ncbi:uncharacterized protein YqeY [Pedobacter sp. W3I1]|nr:uncharacterized protein YqeY [Pedobacter sp. W3I1]
MNTKMSAIQWLKSDLLTLEANVKAKKPQNNENTIEKIYRKIRNRKNSIPITTMQATKMAMPTIQSHS